MLLAKAFYRLHMTFLLLLVANKSWRGYNALGEKLFPQFRLWCFHSQWHILSTLLVSFLRIEAQQ